jgi:hypothetical protein
MRALAILTFLFVSMAIIAQSSLFSVESGAVINTPLKKSVSPTNYGIGFSNLQSKYHLSSGTYIKVEYAGLIKSNRKWSYYMPMGIGYHFQTIKYETQGRIMGDWSDQNVHQMQVFHSQIVNLSCGFMAQYQLNKWSLNGSVLINSSLYVQNTCSSFPYNSKGTHSFRKYDGTDFDFFMSSRIAGVYSVSSKVFLGPSLDVFFLSGGNAADKLVNGKNGNQSDFGQMRDLTGKNLHLNPGIRLQYKIK